MKASVNLNLYLLRPICILTSVINSSFVSKDPFFVYNPCDSKNPIFSLFFWFKLPTTAFKLLNTSLIFNYLHFSWYLLTTEEFFIWILMLSISLFILHIYVTPFKISIGSAWYITCLHNTNLPIEIYIHENNENLNLFI